MDPGQLGREARGQLQCILRVTNNGKDPKVKTPDPLVATFQDLKELWNPLLSASDEICIQVAS